MSDFNDLLRDSEDVAVGCDALVVGVAISPDHVCGLDCQASQVLDLECDEFALGVVDATIPPDDEPEDLLIQK